MHSELTLFIPTYNRSEAIDKRLKEITELEINKDFKILVVNDGSNDSTKTKINKFLYYDNFKIINNEKNLGYTSNLISSIRQIETEYFIFITDDETYTFKNLYKIADMLKIDDIDFLSCHWSSDSSSRLHTRNSTISIFEIWPSAKHASGLIYKTSTIRPFLDELERSFKNGCRVSYFFPHIFLLFNMKLSKKKLCKSKIKIGGKYDSEAYPTNIKDTNGDNYISFNNALDRHVAFSIFYSDLYQRFKERDILLVKQLHDLTIFNNLLLGLDGIHPDLNKNFIKSGVLSSFKPRRLISSLITYAVLKIRILFARVF